MSDKYTPGPFRIRLRKCEVGCCDDIAEIVAKYPEDKDFARPIATVNGGNAVWLRAGEAEANAKLFAAAPDLLAACREALEEEYFLSHGVVEQIRAAIAIAEGGAKEGE